MNKTILVQTLRKNKQASVDRLKVLIAADTGAQIIIHRSKEEQYFMTADDISRAKNTVNKLSKSIDFDDEYVDFVNSKIIEREKRNKELLILRGAA